VTSNKSGREVSFGEEWAVLKINISIKEASKGQYAAGQYNGKDFLAWGIGDTAGHAKKEATLKKQADTPLFLILGH
jgi:hypothetical protein